ncbi:hypothetical protein [Streptomyces sp. CRN 30]|uniref:hypothetical protein n=1 Tax=Streptomyces sp. CRN 30 TaxID=3075613 RepID=UPI002A8389CA|nr:hypothetical protein [Streptomyces sp. CRN 30]
MAIQDPNGDTGADPAARRRSTSGTAPGDVGTTGGPGAVPKTPTARPEPAAGRPAPEGTGSRPAGGLIGGAPGGDSAPATGRPGTSPTASDDDRFSAGRAIGGVTPGVEIESGTPTPGAGSESGSGADEQEAAVAVAVAVAHAEEAATEPAPTDGAPPPTPAPTEAPTAPSGQATASTDTDTESRTLGTGTAEGPAATATTAPSPPDSATAEGATAGVPATARRGRARRLRGLLAVGHSTASGRAPGGPDGTGEDDDTVGPVRVSRPMAAAALMAGVLLIGSPFAIAALLDDGDSPVRRPGAAGYADRTAEDGGFVPSAAATAGGKSGRPGAEDGKDGKDGSGVTTDSKGVEGVEGIDDTEDGDGATGGSGPDSGTGRDGRATSENGSGSDSDSDSESDSGSESGSGTGAAATATARATQKAAAPATYSALGGPHCSGDVTYKESGSSSEPGDGWTSHPGGYSTGCTGVFRSLPISGDSSDAGNSAYWIFRTGKVVEGTCTVSVHIPNDSKRTHVGGTPAYYTLHNATNGGSNQLARFTVDQPSRLGMWVAGPSVRITDGLLTLKLHDRGKEATSNARMAADAAKISCTAS